MSNKKTSLPKETTSSSNSTPSSDPLQNSELYQYAEDGDHYAQYLLGRQYYSNVPPDYKKAVEWWTKSAKQENVKAQHNLGACYAHGEGVHKTMEKPLNGGLKRLKKETWTHNTIWAGPMLRESVLHKTISKPKNG